MVGEVGCRVGPHRVHQVEVPVEASVVVRSRGDARKMDLNIQTSYSLTPCCTYLLL